LKYLFSIKDAKSRLIRWILLLQEFDIEIQDKKGSENVVADHLSRLIVEFTEGATPISETFPDEQLMHISSHSFTVVLSDNKILTSNLTKCVCLCVTKYLKCRI